MLTQVLWLLLPCLGGPLLGTLAVGAALTWSYSAPRTRLLRVLLLASALAAFALAAPTWGVAQSWFFG